MARTCTVCAHPDRAAVDSALAAGVSVREIAKRHGLDPSAVFRHGKRHVAKQMAKARAAREDGQLADADQLLRELHTTKDRILGIMDTWGDLPQGQKLATIPVLFAATREHVRVTELLLKVEIASGRAQAQTPVKGYVVVGDKDGTEWRGPDSWPEPGEHPSPASTAALPAPSPAPVGAEAAGGIHTPPVPVERTDGPSTTEQAAEIEQAEVAPAAPPAGPAKPPPGVIAPSRDDVPDQLPREPGENHAPRRRWGPADAGTKPTEEPDVIVAADGRVIGGKRVRIPTEEEFYSDDRNWRPL